MSTLMRHVGKIGNTGSRVIVVFRELPDDASSCLVVESDRLPEIYHQNMMTIVNSKEAQDTMDLHDVLARRTFGTGEPVLQTLHGKQLLRKEPVANVVMLPMPNMPCPLADINRVANEGKAAPVVAAPVAAAEPEVVDAKGYINKAKELELKAVALREQAYMLDASLRPGRGRPGLSDLDKEARRQERNRKRRENYSQKA